MKCSWCSLLEVVDWLACQSSLLCGGTLHCRMNLNWTVCVSVFVFHMSLSLLIKLTSLLSALTCTVDWLVCLVCKSSGLSIDGKANKLGPQGLWLLDGVCIRAYCGNPVVPWHSKSVGRGPVYFEEQGYSDGGISGIYTLPKSVQINFLWGNNDVRTVTEHVRLRPLWRVTADTGERQMDVKWLRHTLGG